MTGWSLGLGLIAVTEHGVIQAKGSQNGNGPNFTCFGYFSVTSMNDVDGFGRIFLENKSYSKRCGSELPGRARTIQPTRRAIKNQQKMEMKGTRRNGRTE